MGNSQHCETALGSGRGAPQPSALITTDPRRRRAAGAQERNLKLRTEIQHMADHTVEVRILLPAPQAGVAQR